MRAKTIRAGSRTVEVARPDKILFPEAGITKGDLIQYYRNVSDTILPYLKNRLVVMHRFPDGIEEDGFYHKDAPDFFPDWIKDKAADKKEGTVTHVICQNTATLVYLANQGCITPHTWLSRTDKLQHPDQLLFDLDPPSDDFQAVVTAAKQLRELFQKLEMVCYVKTSGSRGLHVLTPLDRTADFDDVRAFAQDVAEILARRHPKTLTVETRKNKRRGRLYLDTTRNAYAQTVAPPYSVRPNPHAPIATPLDWAELNQPGLNSQRYHLRNIFRRLGQKPDPWKNLARHAYSLKVSRERLDHFMQEENER